MFDPLRTTRRWSLKEIRISRRRDSAKPFLAADRGHIRGKGWREGARARGLSEDIRCPSSHGDDSSLSGGKGGRLERKRRRRRAPKQQTGRLCPGIKLIPACVAHQWLQTNRQSDFMLWPVSRWQPTRPPW